MIEEKIIDKLCEIGTINPISAEDIERGFEVLGVIEEIKPCRRYMGVHCIDGSCPKAIPEEYADRGMDVISSCEECFFYRGCEDCAWENTNICFEYKKNNERSATIALD